MPPASGTTREDREAAAKALLRRVKERRLQREGRANQEPGAKYDYDAAMAAGLTPDIEGHWPSRIPQGSEEGRILKQEDHPSFTATIAGEHEAGYDLYRNRKTRFLYSFPRGVQPEGFDLAREYIEGENPNPYGPGETAAPKEVPAGSPPPEVDEVNDLGLRFPRIPLPGETEDGDVRPEMIAPSPYESKGPISESQKRALLGIIQLREKAAAGDIQAQEFIQLTLDEIKDPFFSKTNEIEIQLLIDKKRAAETDPEVGKYMDQAVAEAEAEGRIHGDSMLMLWRDATADQIQNRFDAMKTYPTAWTPDEGIYRLIMAPMDLLQVAAGMTQADPKDHIIGAVPAFKTDPEQKAAQVQGSLDLGSQREALPSPGLTKNLLMTAGKAAIGAAKAFTNVPVTPGGINPTGFSRLLSRYILSSGGEKIFPTSTARAMRQEGTQADPNFAESRGARFLNTMEDAANTPSVLLEQVMAQDMAPEGSYDNITQNFTNKLLTRLMDPHSGTIPEQLVAGLPRFGLHFAEGLVFFPEHVARELFSWKEGDLLPRFDPTDANVAPRLIGVEGFKHTVDQVTADISRMTQNAMELARQDKLLSDPGRIFQGADYTLRDPYNSAFAVAMPFLITSHVFKGGARVANRKAIDFGGKYELLSPAPTDIVDLGVVEPWMPKQPTAFRTADGYTRYRQPLLPKDLLLDQPKVGGVVPRDAEHAEQIYKQQWAQEYTKTRAVELGVVDQNGKLRVSPEEAARVLLEDLMDTRQEVTFDYENVSAMGTRIRSVIQSLPEDSPIRLAPVNVERAAAATLGFLERSGLEALDSAAAIEGALRPIKKKPGVNIQGRRNLEIALAELMQGNPAHLTASVEALARVLSDTTNDLLKAKGSESRLTPEAYTGLVYNIEAFKHMNPLDVLVPPEAIGKTAVSLRNHLGDNVSADMVGMVASRVAALRTKVSDLYPPEQAPRLAKQSVPILLNDIFLALFQDQPQMNFHQFHNFLQEQFPGETTFPRGEVNLTRATVNVWNRQFQPAAIDRNTHKMRMSEEGKAAIQLSDSRSISTGADFVGPTIKDPTLPVRRGETGFARFAVLRALAETRGRDASASEILFRNNRWGDTILDPAKVAEMADGTLNIPPPIDHVGLGKVIDTLVEDGFVAKNKNGHYRLIERTPIETTALPHIMGLEKALSDPAFLGDSKPDSLNRVFTLQPVSTYDVGALIRVGEKDLQKVFDRIFPKDETNSTGPWNVYPAAKRMEIFKKVQEARREAKESAGTLLTDAEFASLSPHHRRFIKHLDDPKLQLRERLHPATIEIVKVIMADRAPEAMQVDFKNIPWEDFTHQRPLPNEPNAAVYGKAKLMWVRKGIGAGPWSGASTVLHEFSHIAWELALDDAGRAEFTKAFDLLSPRQKREAITGKTSGLSLTERQQVPGAGLAEHAASSVQEFHAETTARYLISAATEHPSLKKLLDKTATIYRRAVTKLFGTVMEANPPVITDLLHGYERSRSASPEMIARRTQLIRSRTKDTSKTKTMEAANKIQEVFDGIQKEEGSLGSPGLEAYEVGYLPETIRDGRPTARIVVLGDVKGLLIDLVPQDIASKFEREGWLARDNMRGLAGHERANAADLEFFRGDEQVNVYFYDKLSEATKQNFRPARPPAETVEALGKSQEIADAITERALDKMPEPVQEFLTEVTAVRLAAEEAGLHSTTSTYTEILNRSLGIQAGKTKLEAAYAPESMAKTIKAWEEFTDVLERETERSSGLLDPHRRAITPFEETSPAITKAKAKLDRAISELITDKEVTNIEKAPDTVPYRSENPTADGAMDTVEANRKLLAAQEEGPPGGGEAVPGTTKSSYEHSSNRQINMMWANFGTPGNQVARIARIYNLKDAQKAIDDIQFAGIDIVRRVSMLDSGMDKILDQLPHRAFGEKKGLAIRKRIAEVLDGNTKDDINKMSDLTDVERKVVLELRQHLDDFRGRIKKVYEDAGFEVPDDWGIDGYFPHTFVGDFQIYTTQGVMIGSARTRLGAMKKIYEAGQDGTVKSPNEIRVTVKAQVNSEMFRIGGKRLHTAIDRIASDLGMSHKEVAAAFKGKVGAKENQVKFAENLQKRKGAQGYSTDVRAVLRTYHRTMTRWEYLSKLRNDVEPLVEVLRDQKHDRLADYLSENLDQVWGQRSKMAAELDNWLATVPIYRAIWRPGTAERFFGRIRTTTANLLLRTPRFYVLNSTQPLVTLLPTVTNAEFGRGVKLLLSTEGREIINRHGVQHDLSRFTGEPLTRFGRWAQKKRAQIAETRLGLLLSPEARNQQLAYLTLYENTRTKFESMSPEAFNRLVKIKDAEFTPVKDGLPGEHIYERQVGQFNKIRAKGQVNIVTDQNGQQSRHMPRHKPIYHVITRNDVKGKPKPIEEVSKGMTYREAMVLALKKEKPLLIDSMADKIGTTRGQLYTQFLGSAADGVYFAGKQTSSSSFWKTAVMFRRFQVKNIELGLSLLAKNVAGKRNIKGFNKWLAAQVLLGGGRQIIRLAAGVATARSFFSKTATGRRWAGDLPENIHQDIEDGFDFLPFDWNERLADVASYGVFASVGLDYSYSAQLLDVPMGDSITEKIGAAILGAPGQLAARVVEGTFNPEGDFYRPWPERGVRSALRATPTGRMAIGAKEFGKAAVEGWASAEGEDEVSGFMGALENITGTLYNVDNPEGLKRIELDYLNAFRHFSGFRAMPLADQEREISSIVGAVAEHAAYSKTAAQLIYEGVTTGGPEGSDLFKEGLELIAAWNELNGAEIPIDSDNVEANVMARLENADKDTFERMRARAPQVFHMFGEEQRLQLEREIMEAAGKAPQHSPQEP